MVTSSGHVKVVPTGAFLTWYMGQAEQIIQGAQKVI